MYVEAEKTKKIPHRPVYDQLARRLGVTELHDFQKLALEAVLLERDSFLLVPTGGGKSFCFVMPALVLPGLVLVVSPLIALMRDQQRQLAELDIPSLSFDSLLTSDQKRSVREKILGRQIKVLFVSPERLALPSFRELLRGLPISLVAIDEAHCVHQWGIGFRPEYRRLGAYLDELGYAPRMALTATVTSRERNEIIHSLKMRNPELIVRPNPRLNLNLQIFNKGKSEDIKQRLIKSVCENTGQGIIYAATRKQVEELYHALRVCSKKIAYYHGGMSNELRVSQQESFSLRETDVIIATKAFGMGINYPHIRYVLHAAMPCSIESYVQEIGRAGRDGESAQCILHYGPRDYYIQKFMIEKSFPSEVELLKVFEAMRSFFSTREAFRLPDLLRQLTAVTDLDLQILQTSLDFFYREQVYHLTEIWNEEYFELESYVVPTEKTLDLIDLQLLLRQQIDWRFDKLKAIHQLVKLGQCPRNFIEQYFV